VNNSTDSYIKVLLGFVVGATVIIMIDEIIGIDLRIFPATSHLIHNIACMVWGIILWKVSGR